jgi:hypothetical protein
MEFDDPDFHPRRGHAITNHLLMFDFFMERKDRPCCGASPIAAMRHSGGRSSTAAVSGKFPATPAA